MIDIQEVGQYLHLWRMIEHTALNAEPDSLCWKWSANGDYSTNSAYLATFHGFIQCQAWRLNWNCWTPPHVRLFHWLANLDHCWMVDRLARRSLPHPQCCSLAIRLRRQYNTAPGMPILPAGVVRDPLMSALLLPAA
uniref:Reverse transcriptase zinc-binding domain-containing protein n=1 Tax=Aegilops tauschii subsp. strangulata TaxID=200361 RepID=A0A453RPB1_AEGTS